MYETAYSLDLSMANGNELHQDLAKHIIGELRERSSDARVVLDKNGGTWNWSRWDTLEGDLRDLSKEYPGIIFTVDYQGEDPDDAGCKYFYQGKMQEAPRVYTQMAFDERFLDAPQTPYWLRRSGELRCENPENAKEALNCFFEAFSIEEPARLEYFSEFDHGHLWINCDDGRRWAVCDAEGENCIGGYYFEEV